MLLSVHVFSLFSDLFSKMIMQNSQSSQSSSSELAPSQTIHLMDSVLASQVAAGEVVERPASVLKELVENAIDAGARTVRVELARGGVALLRVSDDGCGMSAKDAQMSLLRHATSKLLSFEDLFDIQKLGFRGEALPSIASVSKMSIVTRRAADIEGTRLIVEAGETMPPQGVGCAPGTMIEVSELFYNTPVRRKFLKSEDTEAAHVEHQLKLHALAYPALRFVYTRNGQLVWDTPGTHDLRQRIADLSGRELAQDLIEIRPYEALGMQVSGYLLPLSSSRRNRKMLHVFLNGRPIVDKIVSRAIRDGYGGFPTGLQPGLFLYLTVDSGLVDVNVHPAKREVRFRRPGDVSAAIMEAIAGSLAYHARHGSAVATPAAALVAPRLASPSVSRAPLGGSQALSRLARGDGSRDEDASSAVSAGPVEMKPKLTLRPLAGARQPAQQLMELPAAAVVSPRATELEARPQIEQLASSRTATMASPAAATSAASFTTEDAAESDICYPSLFMQQAEGLPNFRYVGELAASFAIFENREGLVLLSPRAARERLIFERLMQSSKRPLMQQRLLMPLLLELDVRDFALAMDLLPQLERAGFVVSSFGQRTLRVEAVPAIMSLNESEAFMLELIEHFGSRGESRLARSRNPYESFAQHLARQYAAQEDLRPLLDSAMLLLADLMCCEIPYCTPTGKPTIVPISLNEIKRKFHAL